MERFLTTVAGRSPGDHVCWWFRGPDEYMETAREYVSEGLERRQLVAFTEVTPTSLAHTIVTDVAQVGRPPEHTRPSCTIRRSSPRRPPAAARRRSSTG